MDLVNHFRRHRALTIKPGDIKDPKPKSVFNGLKHHGFIRHDGDDRYVVTDLFKQWEKQFDAGQCHFGPLAWHNSRKKMARTTGVFSDIKRALMGNSGS